MTRSNATGRALASRAATAGVALVLVALLAGSVLGVPVLLSYVETGSMEPTIETGDGFVPIPATSATSVEEDDIVVFEAQEIDGGSLTTHRVVEETEHGYVTEGDANPVTDQESGEPHVTDGQIVATAVEIGDDPITIPHLGTAILRVERGLESTQWRLGSVLGTPAVLGTQGLAYLALAFGLVVIGLSVVRDRGTVTRTRDRSRSRQDTVTTRAFVLGIAALLCITTFGTMLAMSGPTDFEVVSAEFESDRPDVIPMGDTETHRWELNNRGVLPVVTVLEPASEAITIQGGNETLHPGESAEAMVSITAPDETGYYLRSLEEYRYVAVLPSSVIRGLHAVHPWAAMTAVTGTIVGLFTLPFAVLLGSGTIRTRTRRRTEKRDFNR